MKASLRALVATPLLSLCLASCGSDGRPSADATAAPPAIACEPDVVKLLMPDSGGRDEAYVCYGFALGALETGAITSVRWQPPLDGGVVWHHATLSAVLGDFPDGPFACDGMPSNAVSLHVWALGGDDLVLPDGVALALPAGTQRFALEMHVVRVADAPAEGGSVGLCRSRAPVTQLAGFVGVAAPVPAIRPQSKETSAVMCTFANPTHLWSVWPHMHQVGSAVEANLRRGEGDPITLNRIDPWNFHAQRTYPLAVDVRPGDRLVSQCWWTNPTSHYVFPGFHTTDEMCNQGFIGWPAPVMDCEPVNP